MTDFLTPVGRLVAGDAFQPQDKDADGKPLVIKTGPNAGQPRTQFFLGLAIEKTNPEWPPLEQAIRQVARESFPQLFDASGNCIAPSFAFKIIDGDSQIPNTKGTKPCEKEGYAGHWVLQIGSSYAPKIYDAGGKVELTSPNDLKRGYYIRVTGTIKGNGSNQNPGVFLNPRMVERVGYGPEIISGPSAEEVFSKPAAAMPTGMSQTPPAPHPSSTMQPSPPAPAPDPAFTAAPPPAQAEQAYLVNGQRLTHSQLAGAGWTPEQIATLPPAP